MDEVAYKKRLVGGLIASLTCTLFVYFGVTNHWFTQNYVAVLFILGVGFVQALVQVRFFLHLDEEKRPRWQLHSFWFTAVMVLVIVIGSLWVMMNLNYNMGMSPEQMNEYMMKQNKKGF